jgi:hypothetical protein
MTTQTSDVGATLLPLAAGDVGDALSDPIVDAILDFVAWYLNNDLNAKLAKLNGTSEVAVPTQNRFAFDPTEPQGIKSSFKLPALFVWWDGLAQKMPFSQLQDRRVRSIELLYIFQELPATAALELRSGLFAAVDASIAKAAERGYHPSYSYNSKTAGTRLDASIGDYGSWCWDYIGGQGIKRIGLGDSNTTNFGSRNPSTRTAGKSHPAFAGRFRVEELIQPPQPEDPTNITRDSACAIDNDGVRILDRVLEAPDGQNAPDNA